MNELITSLSVLATSIPVMIVWVMGIGLSISRWRRHPRVSQFALIACVIMIVVTVVSRMLNLWLPLIMRERGWTMAQMGIIFTSIGFGVSLISAAGWAMVLCAVFGWRDGRQKEGDGRQKEGDGRQKEDFPQPPPIFADKPREQTQRYEFRNNQ